MRFNLIDRIVEVRPGQNLRAVKNLTLGEEYLADHFPTFPVMPGVLMLQTLVEAASWLLRLTDDFSHSVVALREVRNIKYGCFMEPGRALEVQVELVDRQGDLAVFKGKGESEGQSTVSAKFTLASYNLCARAGVPAATDEQIVEHLRRRAALLQLCPTPVAVPG